MGLLTWLIVGALAGWLASMVIKGGAFGLLGYIIIGVVGAFVGGWLSTQIFNLPYAVTGFNLVSIIVATVGAVVVLFVISLIKR